jgi:hypothetical protein
LRHDDSKPELWSKKKHPLLGYSNLNSQPLLSNGSVNMFPRQPNHMKAMIDMNATDELLGAVFSLGSVPRLYIRNQN